MGLLDLLWNGELTLTRRIPHRKILRAGCWLLIGLMLVSFCCGCWIMSSLLHGGM